MYPAIEQKPLFGILSLGIPSPVPSGTGDRGHQRKGLAEFIEFGTKLDECFLSHDIWGERTSLSLLSGAQ